jgi:uncharacterized membrane protein YkvA (DUF1232 family)
MSDRDFELAKHRDFYQKIRNRVSDWVDRHGRTHQLAEYILAVPDLFHLMVKLFFDSDISWKNRFKLGGAIAYIMSPLDILPETLLGPIGIMDDLALAAYVIQDIIDEVGEEKVQSYWAGKKHILSLVEDIIDLVKRRFGGVWKKIRSYFP